MPWRVCIKEVQIQEESLHYESLKDNGKLPIIGVNTYLAEAAPEDTKVELSRSSDAEKNDQIKRLENFKLVNKQKAQGGLELVRNAALKNENIFEALLEATQYCSLGQITQVLYEVGGRYRRNI